MGECLLPLNAWGTKQRWDTIAFFDTTGVEKPKYISSNAKELKLQDTNSAGAKIVISFNSLVFSRLSVWLRGVFFRQVDPFLDYALP